MNQLTHQIFLRALFSSIFKGEYEELTPDIEDVSQAEGLISTARDSILSAKEARIDGNARTISSPFSFVDDSYRDGPISPLQTGYFSLGRNYLFPTGDEGYYVNQLIEELGEKLSNSKDLNKGGKLFRKQEAILSLCQYFLSTVPLGVQGISLYDYARLSAALAICLHHNKEAKVEPEDMEKTLLVKGDLSGIQSYIFDIASRGAARSLKGRSLRVQVLTTLATRYLLESMELSAANLLFIGGGNFFLLIPKAKEGQLKSLIQEMASQEVGDWQDHLSMPIPEKLHLYMGKAEIELHDFQDFGKKWQEADQDVNAARMEAYPTETYERLFAPIKNINFRKRRKAEAKFFKEGIKGLTKMKGWQIKSIKSDSWIKDWTYDPTKDNPERDESILQEDQKGETIPHPYCFGRREIDLHPNGRMEAIFPDSDDDFLSYHNSDSQLPPSIYLLVKNLPTWTVQSLEEWKAVWSEEDKADKDITEEKADSIISFSALGLKAKYRTGTGKLGILKMDVDHLGRLFQQRLSENYRSIGHTSAISRALKWFFEGYMNTLLGKSIGEIYKDSAHLGAYCQRLEKSQHETFGDNLYIIFSGGDDFFLVGAWDTVMDFAWMVRQAFMKFTGGAATLSAGLVMVDRKYPVSRFADLVEEAEAEAKNFTRPFGEAYQKKGKAHDRYFVKDRISVFGEVLSWEDYKEAMDLRALIYFLLTKEQDREPKALLHKIKDFMYGYGDLQKKVLTSSTLDYQRIWRLPYYLRGIKKTNKPLTDAYILHRYKELLQDTLKSQKRTENRKVPPNPALIGVGARWAEFMSRVQIEKPKTEEYVG